MAAARAGPPFRTDDPEPVEYQHWEVYGFSTATSVAGDTSGTLPGVELNYGALPELQLHVIAPLAFDAPSGSGTKFGMGDTELGVKYRFVTEDADGWRPQIGVFPLVELPTANSGRGLGTGYTQVFLPLWIQKSFGAWTTYGGGGYWHNPGAGNRDYWFAGWLVQRQVTDALASRRRALPPDRRHGGRQRQHRLQSRRHLRFHGELPSPRLRRARARERDEDEPILLLRGISVDVLIATGLAYNRARRRLDT